MSAEQASLDLYRRQLADDARNEGLRRVAASDPDALEQACEVIGRLARAGRIFSANDVRAERPDLAAQMGSAFRRMARRGVIRPTGDIAVATSPSRHGGLVRLWSGTGPVPLLPQHRCRGDRS